MLRRSLGSTLPVGFEYQQASSSYAIAATHGDWQYCPEEE
eukprot:COSAG01_NODE_51823_length_351_cov_1.630952_2_plen_39_part_01